jgi:amidase
VTHQIRRVCAVLAATIVLALAPAFAKTIDFDSATIADLNAAFDAGTLTAEKLVQMCLARIAAFDRKGPSLHAVITLNPKALEQARALDAERKAKGRRSPLHGIPVILKDTTTPSTCRRRADRCCSRARSRRRMRSSSESCAMPARSSSRK